MGNFDGKVAPSLTCQKVDDYYSKCDATSQNPGGQCVCANSDCTNAVNDRNWGDHGIQEGKCGANRKCEGHGQYNFDGKPAPSLTCQKVDDYYSKCVASQGPAPTPTPTPTPTPSTPPPTPTPPTPAPGNDVL